MTAPHDEGPGAKPTEPSDAHWHPTPETGLEDEGARQVPMRLQKFLARAGVASRRGSEELMTAGRVSVNGRTVTELGTRIDPSRDCIAVDGRVVVLGSARAYFVLNKPAGVVTTMKDPQGRDSVASLVPVAEYPGLFPVGRLDRDTTGVLLFTTDGELSHRLLHPRWKVAKTYRVVAEGLVTEQDAERLRLGVDLDDGPTQPAEVRVEPAADASTTSTVEITIHEGRKRQVRRMFSAVAHPVLELHRISFGPVTVGDLALGAVRPLSAAEISALRDAVGMGE